MLWHAKHRPRVSLTCPIRQEKPRTSNMPGRGQWASQRAASSSEVLDRRPGDAPDELSSPGKLIVRVALRQADVGPAHQEPAHGQER
jgi:hypothetical protein